jgi:hypothetical protein
MNEMKPNQKVWVKYTETPIVVAFPATVVRVRPDYIRVRDSSGKTMSCQPSQVFTSKEALEASVAKESLP